MKTENTAVESTTFTEIPPVAHRHIQIEIGRVSRTFRLNETDAADLASHIRCEVRCALRTNYDPTRAKVYSFIQGVVHRELCAWMRDETRRRNRFTAMTDEIAQKAEACAWDPEALRRLEVMAEVRAVVARLTGDSRRICRHFLRYGSLEKVRLRLRMDKKTFYFIAWPNCRKDFSGKWKLSETDSPSSGE